MPHHYEADFIEGLDEFARAEVERLGGASVTPRPGALQFNFKRDLRPLLTLKTVLAVYLVQRFDVPRPKALLGDQHLRALLGQVDTVLALSPSDAYRTFMLGAAGSDSTVMARIKAEITRHTGLREVEAEGDLLVRVRRSSSHPSPLPPPLREEGARGWDVLVRLSPRPLATRDWRVCNIAGSLQATVAHAMALLTEPKPTDVYLNLGCGSGTLLIERALAGPVRRLIGCDTDPNALACARENISAFGKGAPRNNRLKFEIHVWDARALPLPEESVDALTADLPFGNLIGSHDDNAALYPALMREAARVARPGARFALITAEVRLMERVLDSMKSLWRRERSLRVNLGGLRPAIFVLRKV